MLPISWRTVSLSVLLATGPLRTLPTSLPESAVPGAGDDPSSLVDGSGLSSSPGADLTVRVRPRQAYAGSLVSLEVMGTLVDQVDARIRWRSNGGSLHYDDLAEVRWRAPARPGTYQIEVTVESGRREERVRIDLDVREASTADIRQTPEGTDEGE